MSLCRLDHAPNDVPRTVSTTPCLAEKKQEGLAVASIARDDPSPLYGMHRDPMHFRHRQTDPQTDTDIVA